MPYDTFNTYGGAAAMHEDTATTKARPLKTKAGEAVDKIRFMVVSGFLGAGKTTTMIALGMHMGVRVRVFPAEEPDLRQR